jgi:hypothetical protein
MPYAAIRFRNVIVTRKYRAWGNLSRTAIGKGLDIGCDTLAIGSALKRWIVLHNYAKLG